MKFYIEYDDEFEERINGNANKNINDYEEFEVIPETVGKFIGKHDSEGTKIFEGDILQDGDDENEDNFGVVIYDNDDAGFKLIEDGITYDFSLIDTEDYTVIDNISDSPKLELEK